MFNTLRVSLTSEKISRRLRIRLWIFFVIAIGLLAYIGWDVYSGYATWWSALIALVIGAVIGIPLGMLRSVSWHETREEVVSQLDVTGGIAIAAYVILDASRDWLLGHWFTGEALTTLAFAALAGLLFGRLIGMNISIQRVLGERK